MRLGSRGWFVLTLAVGVASSSLPAQTRAERTLITAFRDSLDRAPDSTGLRRLDARMVQRAQQGRPDPFRHLRMGFLALRLGELGRARAYEEAAMEFETVTRLAPRWPFGWYGLGLAEYALGRANATGVSGEVENPVRPYARAITAFSRSASSDPSFVTTLVDEAYLGRRWRDPSRSTVAVAAMRLAARGKERAPPLLHGLGRLEREFGDPELALEAFDALLRASGRNRGLPLLEIARTRFLLGRADGAAAYYEGAAYDDSATVEAYRLDLAVIAIGQELAQYDAVRSEDRVRFLRRFWGSRDAAEFREAGERLQEHYRRLYFARRSFPGFEPTRWRDLTRRIALADELDHRGVLYIRHGEPDDRVSLSTLGVEPNESWRYARPEGDLVLHFVARHAPDDFHLVESLFDVAESRLAAGGPPRIPRSDATEQLLRSREPLSPFYRTGAQDRAVDFEVAERALSRASMHVATTTDTYRRRYPKPLGVTSDLVLFGDSPAGVLARVALAVPFSATGTAWLGGGLTFPLRLRLVGLDDEGWTAVTLDTLFRAEAVTFHEARWLAGTLSLPLPEGRLRVRLAVEDDDKQEGTVLPFRALEITRPAPPLAISDLAIGEVDTPWRMPLVSGQLFLDPVGALDRDRLLELAFEVRGEPGRTLSCQLTVIRTDAQPGVAINRAWSEAMPEGSRMIRHRIEPRRLRPGFYRVEITVTDGPGVLVRRWREFRVVQ